MPTSPTSPFGGSRSKALITSAASDVSSISLQAAFCFARRLIDAEADIVEHMNSHHADTIELYAKAVGAAAGSWRMTGIDPEGCDIVLDDAARRILFAVPVRTSAEARKELVRLAGEARSSAGP